MTLKNKNRLSKGYIVDEVHRFDIFLEKREIFLHGYIDNTEEDPGVEYRMSNVFLKNIRLLEEMDDTKPIITHQHSVGGNWAEGMMIYDAIKSCNAPVVCITHGMATSMGSIIPLAADLVVTMPNCLWMIHDGYVNLNVTYKQAISWNEWNKVTKKKMMEIYVSRCKNAEFFEDRTDKYIINFIEKKLEKKEDWWFSTEDAIKYGFCDGIYGEEGYSNMQELINNVS